MGGLPELEGYDASTGVHTVRYLVDDEAEDVELDKEQKRWLESRPELPPADDDGTSPADPPPLVLPPPEPQAGSDRPLPLLPHSYNKARRRRRRRLQSPPVSSRLSPHH